MTRDRSTERHQRLYRPPSATAKRRNAPLRPSRIRSGRKTGYLSEAAVLAGWATPQASDHVEGSRTKPESRQKCLGRDLAGWASPREADGAKNVRTTEGAMREAKWKGANNDLGVTALPGP